MRRMTSAAWLLIVVLFPGMASPQPLRFGEQPVIVYFPGPGHSPDHSVVYFPAQRTLFGGCTVRDGFLGNVAEADLARWPESIRNLDRFDAEVVIPGHGNPGTKDLLKGTAALLERPRLKIGTASPLLAPAGPEHGTGRNYNSRSVKDLAPGLPLALRGGVHGGRSPQNRQPLAERERQS